LLDLYERKSDKIYYCARYVQKCSDVQEIEGASEGKEYAGDEKKGYTGEK
jgi:hypothetical protein